MKRAARKPPHLARSVNRARALAVENRRVVPFTSFSEFSKAHGGDVWFCVR